MDNADVAFSRVLLAYDGSGGARKALESAIDIARTDGAELVTLAVEAHLPHYGATVGEVEEERRLEESECAALLREASARAATRDVKIKGEIRAGHPAKAILEAAKEHNVDLVVIGHSGHSGVWEMFLGSTAEKVSRHASCSVLVVR